MVGYAYSYDDLSLYGYIVIKAYECDAIEFINSTTHSVTYIINRLSDKTVSVIPEPRDTVCRLSAECVAAIVDLLLLSESELDYPTALSWSVTPSGICNRVSYNEHLSVWPVPSAALDKTVSYINITNLCFKKMPTYLEISFLTDVLNEVVYLCGIYESDVFTYCGNQIFCSSQFALALKDSYCLDVFDEGLAVVSQKRKKKLNINRILKCIAELYFDCTDFFEYNSILVNIKRNCINSIIGCIKGFALKEYSFKRLRKLMQISVSRAIYDIMDMSSQFLMRSGAGKSADMKYLSFDKILMIFSFPISHTQTRNLIKVNRHRYHCLKTMEIPIAICDGKLLYEKR